MFYNCSSIVSTPKIKLTTLANNCCQAMFSKCENLVKAPKLPSTKLASYCYREMFNRCSKLEQAPELPALELVTKCYTSMFNECNSLNYVKALFTTNPGSDYTGGWVNNVSETGTFVKNADATWDVTGMNGIPTGWTIETV